MRANRLALLGAALALAIESAPASAQLLTFVAATGNDANTCLVQTAPCKTLQKAINVTAATGEVRILSQLQSSGVVLKSLTIAGGGNTLVGTIAINSASAIVTLKDLDLNGVGGITYGINILAAAAVHVENTTVGRYDGNGIVLSAGAATELFVSNTVVRDTNGTGFEVDASASKVTVEDSRFENNADAGILINGAQASISRSIAAGNVTGFWVTNSGTANITLSTANTNGDGFSVASGAQMSLASCVSLGNAKGLLVGGGSTARVSNSVFTDNGTGISSGGTAQTLGDNVIAGNGTDLSGALTPLAGL